MGSCWSRTDLVHITVQPTTIQGVAIVSHQDAVDLDDEYAGSVKVFVSDITKPNDRNSNAVQLADEDTDDLWELIVSLESIPSLPSSPQLTANTSNKDAGCTLHPEVREEVEVTQGLGAQG